MTLNCYNTIVKLILTALIPFDSFRIRGDRKLPPFVNDTNLVMSPNFAEFLLDTTNNGNEILEVLEDIVEVVETGGTDL